MNEFADIKPGTRRTVAVHNALLLSNTSSMFIFILFSLIIVDQCTTIIYIMYSFLILLIGFGISDSPNVSSKFISIVLVI